MMTYEPIYHLVPARYYEAQPTAQPYLPDSFEQEGFIHCTAELPLLLKIANLYFAELPDTLLVLEIDPARLDSPLKFEAPLPPATAPAEASPHDPEQLFPHIYGPLNREAIGRVFPLVRNEAGHWDSEVKSKE
jgi:uncharacterized protein (DUF952 family)